MKQANKILIVEDEILIADTIGRYLNKAGFSIIGPAISFEDAVNLYESEFPDFVLIDIRLNGTKTGIDLANYIVGRARKTPFIFLTSQTDRRFVNLAKETRPAGYLAKPIRKETLLTTIEIALHNAQNTASRAFKQLKISDGKKIITLNTQSILFLEATHIYTKLIMDDGETILQRKSLGSVLSILPPDIFVQTHRGFAINCLSVSHWDNEKVYLGEKYSIPISRSRRKEVMECIQKNLAASG